MSETQAQQESAFPLAGIAMELLRTGRDEQERLSFCSQGQEALAVGMDALFASGRPAVPALTELLGLATVLEDAEQSPSAATLIRSAVAAHARAMAALGIKREDTGALRRGVARLTGASEIDRAPVFGASLPKGALSVSKVIDPLAMERTRAGNKGPPAAKSRTPSRPTPTPSAPTRRRFVS